MAWAFEPQRTTQCPCQRLPETALHVTSRRLMSPLSAVPLTWADVWTRRVLHGSVNRPRIDGRDGIAALSKGIPSGCVYSGGSDTRCRHGAVGSLGVWA